MRDADPAHYVRGQYEGYRTSTGVADDSTTETYAALRLEIDNWRWSGVPFFIRTGKDLPATQTELRLVFHRPAAAGLPPRPRTGPSPTSSSSSSTRRPASGCSSTPSAATTPTPEQINLDMEFADEGGEGPTPVRGAAARGDDGRQHALHPPGRRRGDVAGPAAAARLARRRSTPTRRDRGARRPRTSWSPTTAAGTAPGWRHERAEQEARPAADEIATAAAPSAEPAQSAAAPSPFPPIADYAFLSNCHTGALVAPGRGDRLALRAALRLAERVRHPARPRGRQLPARAVRDQRARPRASTSPARTSSPRPGTRRPAG